MKPLLTIRDSDPILNFDYKKGKLQVFPAHSMVKNWLFEENEMEEAMLAHTMAIVAEKNGMTVNDISHLFPAVLRMLKSDNGWAK